MRIAKKAETSGSQALLQRIGSVLLALVIAGVIIAAFGYHPIIVYKEMIIGALGSGYCIKQTILKIVPLLIMALGVSVCFRMNFINIGAEGQFYAGATAATWVVLHQGAMPDWLAMLLLILAAFVFGGLWCMFAGVLKVRLGVSETLVRLMLNYVAVKLVSYLQYNLWKDPNAYGYPKIANYPVGLQLPQFAGIHCGWLAAIVLTILIALLMKRSKLGYEITVLGKNRMAARYAGMQTTRIELLAGMLGGGLCGLAGMIQASGFDHTLNDSMTSGMGFTAIVIAYMAKMEPGAIAVVSVLFAILTQGGSYIQSSMQIPAAAADMMQGIILLFALGSEFFTSYKIVLDKPERGGRV